MKAPARVPYLPKTLGASGQTVSLELTNTSPTPIEVADIDIRFSATREGVPFACDREDHSKEHIRGTLGPGETRSFDHGLDCLLPLPGTYEIAAAIRIKGATDEVPASRFRVTVDGGARPPKAVPERPGLYLTMVGETVTRPLPKDAWARGDYHVLVAATNGSASTLPLGSARIAFFTYRKGSALPCSGQTGDVPLPGAIAPGVTSVVPVAVSCAPAEEGEYDIVGRLTLGNAPELEIGRVTLTVTRDPLLFTPLF